MKKKSIIHCDYGAVHKYGLPGTIEARELFENQKYQNEVKIEELREKKCQERMEKEEKATASTKAAFEAWLKNKGKEPPAR